MKKFKERLPRFCAALLCAALLVGVASCSNASGGAALPTAPGGSPAGTPGGTSVATTYKVNIAASIEHGSVAASPTSAAAGTEITLTATADQGYVWSSYTVTGAGGAAVAVSAQGKFTMPASDVTVSATFVVGASATLSNFASVVSSLTQDSTIAMTGQLTSSDLATIKSALQASQYMIKLDLRGVTGLDSLPRQALDVCPNLQSLSLPEGLASIGHNALTGCENLESLYLPASFSSFDENAFDISSPTNVFTSINIAEGNLVYSSVDGVLFSKDKKTLVRCPQGKSGAYTVPAGVTTIGPNAFDGCRKLTGIALPDNLLEICKNAFRFTSIAGMTIPSSVVTIYNDVFSGNTSLTSLTFDDATDWYSTNNQHEELRTRSGGTSASLGDVEANATAFKNGNSDYYYKAVATSQNVATFTQNVAALTGDSTVKLEGQIKQTDLAAIYNAIKGASHKVKLDMSGATGLSSLPEQAFEDCANLQEVILPQGIASIGNLVFSACSDLESVSLPASVTSIGRDAFDPPNLLSVNVDQGNAVCSSVDGVLFSKDKKTLIFCPRGKSGSFAIPSGVKVIGKSAFAWCSNLTGLTIPDGVEKIEADAFLTLGITRLALPDSVTVMEENALLGCSSLTSLTLSANLTKIGDLALSGIGVESLVLPASVTSIESQAFQSCSRLKSLVIPASVTSIGQNVFNNCSALNSVEVKAPSGWKRTTDSNYWEWRTHGESVDEGDLSNSTQNAAKLKSSGTGNDDWARYYWYK